MKKLALLTATVASFVYASPVMADSINLCSGGAMAGALCDITLSKAVMAGIQAILVLALVLAFVFLVFGGIKWIMSGGDKGGTEAAKGTITAALIGLVVVFLAWAFINLVGNFFGVGGANQALDIGTIK